MNGRAEVWRLKTRLDATFARAGQVGSNTELQADFARFLCILVSGYMEKAVTALVLEHARRQSAPSIQRFVEYRMTSFTNVNAQRLQQLMGSFDLDWERNLEQFLIDEKKAAIDSIRSLRNAIAHGEHVGITYTRISDYYKEVQKIIERVANLCSPQA